MAYSFRDPDHLYAMDPRKRERIEQERKKEQEEMQKRFQENPSLYYFFRRPVMETLGPGFRHRRKPSVTASISQASGSLATASSRRQSFPSPPFFEQPGPRPSVPAPPRDVDPNTPIGMTKNAPPDLTNWLLSLINDRQGQMGSERAGEAENKQSSDTREPSDASRLLGLVSGTPMQFWSVQPPLHFRF